MERQNGFKHAIIEKLSESINKILVQTPYFSSHPLLCQPGGDRRGGQSGLFFITYHAVTRGGGNDALTVYPERDWLGPLVRGRVNQREMFVLESCSPCPPTCSSIPPNCSSITQHGEGILVKEQEYIVFGSAHEAMCVFHPGLGELLIRSSSETMHLASSV